MDNKTNEIQVARDLFHKLDLDGRRVSPEQVGLPAAQQVARLRRHLRAHAPETVALITSLPPSELTAAQGLAANRAAWGIESGLNQRLDVSYVEELCRGRHPRALRILGMLRRFSHSLFWHWCSRQQRSHKQTPTDFFSAMNAEHHREAFRCLFARKPTFQTPS